MPVDLRLAAIVVQLDLAEELHADHGEYEEHHGNEKQNVRQRLERLEERPEECANAFVAVEKLEQAHDAKEPEKLQVRMLIGLFHFSYILIW